MSKKRVALVALAGILCIAGMVVAQVKIDSNTFGGLRARSIGPAVMSGRISAIDAVAEDPLTVYVGAASGGVWKSKDGGITWDPVFDKHTQSIGAIAIDPGNPEVVWVGTGETWSRNSVSVGTGLYKSTNGGDSWKLIGLEDSERIARIVIDSENTDTVYVCAMGHLWDANEERGLYKTTDAGESWENVLYVDEDTGCSDVAIDPQDPNTLYAGMWQFRRYPDFFDSGGAGSGLFKTTDGGATWAEVTNGLPAGEKGRIAVAVAPSRPRRVYAVVEAENTALYRSDDLGASWVEVNNSFNVGARPFYFAYIVVDPVDPDRIYKPGLYLAVSTDAGKAFTSIFSGGFSMGVHSDHHALWINPTNPYELVLGTDGGVYMSYDRGSHFRLVKALPVSQFYEVSYDFDYPYNVFGGLQDNGSWMGPSRSAGGVGNNDWQLVGFGDGFHTYRDPNDTDVIYAEFQGGNLLRYHVPTEELKWIAPLPREGEEDYRFNWNAALHLSPNTPGTVYYGAQYVFRSRDQGESWEKISPDLTTNDPERQRQLETGGLTIDNSTAENNTTIYAISESPKNEKVIWVGTDDGYVQVTRDGGESWTNVTANIPDLPAGLWVSHVEASSHDEATAHVTVDGHRSGDMTPYVYRTTDFGATWESVVGDGLEGFAHVVVQDLVNPDLMFVGTEFGLYITLDRGMQWARFSGDLPPVPVRDLDIHPREHDLIVGTHGRGIYILDDLTPLRSLTQEILESDFVLLPARDSVMTVSGGLSWFTGHDEFVGRNPPEAANIFFYQRKRHIFGDLKIEIYDDEGELVSTVPAPKFKGLNRADWPMRLPPPKMAPATALAPAFVGPRVPEGTYTFKLLKGKNTYEGTVNLVADPRSPHSAEDRKLQQETGLELYRLLERLTYVVDTLIDLEEQTDARAEELGGSGRLATRLENYGVEVDDLRKTLVSTSKAGWISGDEKLREKLANVYGAVTTYDGRPTQSQIDRTLVLEGQLEEAEKVFETLTTSDTLAALNSQLEGRSLAPLAVMTREAWEEKQEQGGAGSTTVSAKSLARLMESGALLPHLR
jgi:photosystem II stability/assembly factor-like uncharacterized protein